MKYDLKLMNKFHITKILYSEIIAKTTYIYFSEDKLLNFYSILESLAGVLLLDGGWKIFKKIFGALLAPYLFYFINFREQILTNIMETFVLKS